MLPTPVLGVVGLIEDADRVVRRAFRAAGDVVVLLGESRDELGGSEYLKVMHGLIRGVPPALDLAREAALQRVLVEGAAAGIIRSAHDCAEGGLAVTLAECCFDTALGVDVDVPAVVAGAAAWRDVATLFGESASRVVVSVSPEQVDRAAGAGCGSRAFRQRVSASSAAIAFACRSTGARSLDEPLGCGWSGSGRRRSSDYFERRTGRCALKRR